MKLYPAILLLLIGLSFQSCSESNIADINVDIPESSWKYANAVKFPFEVSDTSQKFNLNLEVVHTDSFRYENVYVKIHTLMPDGKKLDQILSLELAGKNGVWQGKKSGKEITAGIRLQEKAKFNQLGKYLITIEQFMRYEPILGISSLRLKVATTQ